MLPGRDLEWVFGKQCLHGPFNCVNVSAAVLKMVANN